MSPPRKRSERETSTDRRSDVVGEVVRDPGAMGNCDVQAAAHPGICNSGETVETLGEVMVQIERHFVEGARAGTAEVGDGCAGLGITAEVVLPLLIPGQGDVSLVV